MIYYIFQGTYMPDLYDLSFMLPVRSRAISMVYGMVYGMVGTVLHKCCRTSQAGRLRSTLYVCT